MGDVLLLLHSISSACKECCLALKQPQICVLTLVPEIPAFAVFSSVCMILYDFVTTQPASEKCGCQSQGIVLCQASLGSGNPWSPFPVAIGVVEVI